ncbi:hypothetical protein P2318_13175 [Myxococcaceae bacterium GXIMD 01537]
MKADELLTTGTIARAIAEEAERLPRPTAEELEAVRERLKLSERPAADAAWPQVLQAPREKKDTRYAEPATSHRPVVGPVLVLAKRTFRGLFQPFINEVMRRQVEFNEAILDSLALIYEQQQERARAEMRWREAQEARLRRLEQQHERTRQPRRPQG